MQKWDDRILEILDEEGPRGVGYINDHRAIHSSHSTVSRRLSDLAAHGLVSERGNGVYMITDKGKAYLNEEYDAENEVYLSDSEPRSENGASDTNTA
ncbi:DNA-binding PadR family transcriptional regulator [Halarchaeum solikamskense]|uniref:MarR family transcriptional regulator n=1 Tax=Halarchaeum nitratireducens TaxID=489913 RepID=UPI001FD90796|nr:MarR family transcriptional regulator [Halarchaeum solikamskense]MBP2250757.1 DNA-binding PadR family transcriptional regulator [Halarchaeum solikamskense]